MYARLFVTVFGFAFCIGVNTKVALFSCSEQTFDRRLHHAKGQTLPIVNRRSRAGLIIRIGIKWFVSKRSITQPGELEFISVRKKGLSCQKILALKRYIQR